MDDVTAGIVNNAPVKEKAAAPQAERPHRVGEGMGRCADDTYHGCHGVERRGLGGLKVAVAEIVDGGGKRRLLDEELLAESRAGSAPKGEELLAEGHLICPGDPADDDGGEGVERHEGGVDGPFFLDNASVEDD
nr:hypothetical protein CDL12_06077 [Ipomoea batatas]